MQITINVPDANIQSVLYRPHSAYWALELQWNGVNGFVLEHEGERRTELDREKLRSALIVMAQSHSHQFACVIAGDGDGVTGDTLLQLMAFGELVYG